MAGEARVRLALDGFARGGKAIAILVIAAATAQPISGQGRIAGATTNRSVLIVDIGGTSVKILATAQEPSRSFPSGPTLTPARGIPVMGTITRRLDGSRGSG